MARGLMVLWFGDGGLRCTMLRCTGAGASSCLPPATVVLVAKPSHAGFRRLSKRTVNTEFTMFDLFGLFSVMGSRRKVAY